MSSGEHRRPSDTTPIDRDELRRMVEESKPPSERETGRFCPSCGGVDRMPPCLICRDRDGVSVGWVSDATYLRWMRDHGANRLVPCPECFGDGATLQPGARGGEWRPVECGLCEGTCRVPPGVALVHRP